MERKTIVGQEKNQDDFVEINETDAIDNLSAFSSEKLADIVIMHRYLGLYADLATAAMKELAVRREHDEVFEYETYIKNHLDRLPKLKVDLGSINNLVAKLKTII